MRGSPLLQAARSIPREPVPFKAVMPLKLKSTVSGKGDNTSEVCCIYEMSVLFQCFKTNEFDQSVCSKEIEAFKKCYSSNVSKKAIRKEKESKGILIPGDRSLSHKQLNLLLKKYPNIK